MISLKIFHIDNTINTMPEITIIIDNDIISANIPNINKPKGINPLYIVLIIPKIFPCTFISVFSCNKVVIII